MPPRETESLGGAAPSIWDDLHRRNAPEGAGVYPLRSAPERAILASALAHCRLRPGDRVLELGCGASRFLPQLALTAGVEVAGVDFSEEGVAQTRRALVGVGVDCGEISLGAIEAYVPRVEGSFDAVVSFGLVEHFDDLELIVAQHFQCARPGGRVFVEAPNLSGPNLAWMRRVAPSLLKWHRPLDAERVAAAFRAAGATDVSVEHLGGPRLFAPPDPGRLSAGAWAVRKTVNGLGELASRVAPRGSARLAGAPLSAYFAVSGTRPE